MNLSIHSLPSCKKSRRIVLRHIGFAASSAMLRDRFRSKNRDQTLKSLKYAGRPSLLALAGFSTSAFRVPRGLDQRARISARRREVEEERQDQREQESLAGMAGS